MARHHPPIDFRQGAAAPGFFQGIKSSHYGDCHAHEMFSNQLLVCGVCCGCPKRYKLPADAVETHVVRLIKSDLERLGDDETFQQYIAEEIARIAGNDDDASKQLQRRLAELDHRIAKLRDHLRAMDVATATALGFYDEAKNAATERQAVERQLRKLEHTLPKLPAAMEISIRAKI